MKRMFPVAAFALLCAAAPSQAWEGETKNHNYDRRGLTETAERFFGDASSGIAEAIENAVDKYGTPNAYIAGEEVSAAFIGGVRYGRGTLTRKLEDGNDHTIDLHWQGPSAGYDFGASASKSFFLVYDLKEPDHLMQRFPAVEGNFYLGPGLGITYKRTGGVTLVPVRAGLGVRAGVSAGYVHFTEKASWIPF